MARKILLLLAVSKEEKKVFALALAIVMERT